MLVDSYRWLPPSLKTYFATRPSEGYEGVPWTPLALPLRAATVALVTTAGINLRGVEPPFDYAREKAEPHWGDPSFRAWHPKEPSPIIRWMIEQRALRGA